jgi:hypothetical protein
LVLGLGPRATVGVVVDALIVNVKPTIVVVGPVDVATDGVRRHLANGQYRDECKGKG